MTYQQQIKDPRWQKKRLQVFNLHKFKCQVCGTKTEELHAHHPFYKRGAMIWEYDKTELECLCHRCHKNAHEIDEKIKRALAVCRDKQKVLDFILGTNNALTEYRPEREVKMLPPLPTSQTAYFGWTDEEIAEYESDKAKYPDTPEGRQARSDEFFKNMKELLA